MLFSNFFQELLKGVESSILRDTRDVERTVREQTQSVSSVCCLFHTEFNQIQCQSGKTAAVCPCSGGAVGMQNIFARQSSCPTGNGEHSGKVSLDT